MSVRENLDALAKHIPAGCTLIAVSKTQPVEKIKEAFDCGQRVFGENRAQEMTAKHEALPTEIQWHMIGHLQSNKVKYIAPFVHLIHSVDSPKLLDEINRQAAKVKRIIACLLQVHIAEEETKFGFSADEVRALIASGSWSELRNIEVLGLMGMATFTDNGEQVRREFRNLKMLFEQLKSGELPPSVRMQELSMGMSGDFRIALEEGSTMIRVGTAIFGQRV
jgi:pyridoxal phosphate enzyme (YggS family)